MTRRGRQLALAVAAALALPAAMTRRGRQLALAVAAALALPACVVVPQTREVYDTDCRTMTHRITLEAAVVGGFQSCRGDACAVMLVAMGAVTAASAVVSGSIAVVGNVVYWFERQGRCAT